MISSDHRSPKISSEMLTGQPERRFVLDFPTTFRTPYQCHLQNASRPIVKFSGACGKFVLLRKHNTDAARGTRLAVVSGNEGRCETKRSVDRSAANPCGDLHQRKPSADRVVRARDSDPPTDCRKRDDGAPGRAAGVARGHRPAEVERERAVGDSVSGRVGRGDVGGYLERTSSKGAVRLG